MSTFRDRPAAVRTLERRVPALFEIALRKSGHTLASLMASDPRAHRFLIFALLASAVLLGAILYPLASPLFLAAVLAGVLYPLQKRLTDKLRYENLSAGILVGAVVLVLVGPLAGLSAFVVKEGAEGLAYVQQTVASEGVSGLLERLPAPVQKIANEGFERLTKGSIGRAEGLEKRIEEQGAKAAAAVGAVLSATSSFLFQAAMMLIALFFLLVQGRELIDWLDGISPLQEGQTRELFAEFRRVSYSVIVSTVVTAAVQAIVALLGYFIAHVPHPVFFAAATFFVAFVPAVGAASVCIVCALMLFVTGHPYMAVFLAIWGIAVVGLVDNLVKPLLIRGGLQMPGAVIFFSLIGGLAMFGTIGLLLGPLAVAMFLALLRMYQRALADAR
jgi:predicted PurR-regulated permease PerM